MSSTTSDPTLTQSSTEVPTTTPDPSSSTTPLPVPTDTSSSSATTSISTSSTSTSGTTTASSTTATSTTTTPTSASATTPTLTTTQTSAGPQVVTSTSVLSITQSRSTPAPSSSATAEASSSKGFFQNTGAVAGTFSAVGVVGLIILILLVTTTLRRRRAKKFDQEIAEAAREAAATQPPAFLDDDDDYRGGFGMAGGYKGGPYSDVSSHGTYQQSPMAAESYGMREIGHGPAPGEVFDYNAAGNAGIGVARARSMTGNGANYGQALQDGASPYAAFAVPTSTASPPPQQHPYPHSRSNELDVMEAAGMGAHVAGAGASLARGPSQYQSEAHSEGLQRNKSLRSHEGEIVYPSAGSGQSQYHSAGSDSYAGFNAPQKQPGHAVYPPQDHQLYGGQQYDGADDMEDAYGGYVVSDSQPQPHGASSLNQSRMVEEDHYGSPDDGEPRMVLKVANQ